jgi:hypothetical protein
LILDIDPEEFRRGRSARDCWVLISGKHEDRHAAFDRETHR